MFLVLREFDVKQGCEARFESVYGPHGDWARLFRRNDAYQRTLLLRDPFRDHAYLTCDFWKTREACDAFRHANAEAYHALDECCEDLTSSERKIGSFEKIADGD
ncbi:MAG: hypothetical protein WBG02_03855 [Candidatus Acidiferrum sp.]